MTNDNNATTDPSKVRSSALQRMSLRAELTGFASQLLSLGLPSDPPTRLTLAEPLSAQVANGGTVQLYKGFLWP